MHGELLSYVFFAGEFAEALIKLGRADAQRWIDEHPADLWQLDPLPAWSQPPNGDTRRPHPPAPIASTCASRPRANSPRSQARKATASAEYQSSPPASAARSRAATPRAARDDLGELSLPGFDGDRITRIPTSGKEVRSHGKTIEVSAGVDGPRRAAGAGVGSSGGAGRARSRDRRTRRCVSGSGRRRRTAGCGRICRPARSARRSASCARKCSSCGGRTRS